MKLLALILISFFLGVLAGYIATMCTLIRQVQKQRYWFREHEHEDI